jgi:hypothetical protein
VKQYERKGLLERVDREGATIGSRIPEEITVQGEPIALREFVFEIKRRETIPPGERERVERAKRNLRRERRERYERLEVAEISREEGEALVESIVGLDRALEALTQLRPRSVEAEIEAQTMADRKRWMSFLKQALGQREDATTRGGR